MPCHHGWHLTVIDDPALAGIPVDQAQWGWTPTNRIKHGMSQPPTIKDSMADLPQIWDNTLSSPTKALSDPSIKCPTIPYQTLWHNSSCIRRKIMPVTRIASTRSLICSTAVIKVLSLTNGTSALSSRKGKETEAKKKNQKQREGQPRNCCQVHYFSDQVICWLHLKKSMDKCNLKIFSIAPPKSWTTLNRVNFIVIWKLSVTLSNANKCSENHYIVEDNVLMLQEFTEGCDDADFHCGKYNRVEEGKKKTR